MVDKPNTLKLIMSSRLHNRENNSKEKETNSARKSLKPKRNSKPYKTLNSHYKTPTDSSATN